MQRGAHGGNSCCLMCQMKPGSHRRCAAFLAGSCAAGRKWRSARHAMGYGFPRIPGWPATAWQIRWPRLTSMRQPCRWARLARLRSFDTTSGSTCPANGVSARAAIGRVWHADEGSGGSAAARRGVPSAPRGDAPATPPRRLHASPAARQKPSTSPRRRAATLPPPLPAACTHLPPRAKNRAPPLSFFTYTKLSELAGDQLPQDAAPLRPRLAVVRVWSCSPC